MLLQIVWALCSAILVGTIFISASTFALVDELIVPTILLFLAPIAFAAPADQRLLIKAVSSLGVYAGVVSIMQSMGFSGSVFPLHLSSGLLSEEIPRAGGPFLQAGANGAALAMCLPLAFALYRSSHSGWRIFAGISIAASFVGALLTLTRSAWIGALGAAVVYFAYNARLRRLIPVMLGAVATAVVVALVLVPGLFGAVTGRLGTERSLDDRSTTNAAALAMLDQNPIAGVGWGRFLPEVDDYVRQLEDIPLTTTHILAHNVVLSRAAELGAVGALLIVATLLAGPVRASFTRTSMEPGVWQGVLPSAFVGWFTVAMFTPMGYAFPNYLLWILVGIALADGFYLRRTFQPSKLNDYLRGI
jgi:O-antigen ligase